MEFKSSNAPSYRGSIDLNEITTIYTKALFFLSVCAIILQYSLSGLEGALRAISIMVVAVMGCVFTNGIFWKLKSDDPTYIQTKLALNVPIITGLIIALFFPLGDFSNKSIFLSVLVAAITGELIGKLIFGGFGKNIINPAALGCIIAFLLFKDSLVVPIIDGLSNQTPLQALSQGGGIEGAQLTFNNYTSLLLGTYQGSIGTTMVIPIVVTGIYLIYKNVINWLLPLSAIISLGIFSFFIMFIAKLDFSFVLLQLLGGSYIFVSILMLSDPVTSPVNRQGIIIFGMIFAAITLFLRINFSLIDGTLVALVLVNLLVPFINKICSNVTNTQFIKKLVSIIIVFVILISILFIGESLFH